MHLALIIFKLPQNPEINNQLNRQTDRQTDVRIGEKLDVHIVHIATYSRTKLHAPSFNSFSDLYRTDGRTDGMADRRTDGGQTYSPL